MRLSKNAIRSLIANSSAVLKKCPLPNVVGSLALSGMLVMGGVSIAQADAPSDWARLKNANSIASTSRIARAGAVPQMSIMASDSLTEAIGSRMNSARTNTVRGTIQQAKVDTVRGKIALWITPLWKNQSGSGLEANTFSYGYTSNIGGLALGADYAFNEYWKAGFAFSTGGGYAESFGDLARTSNSMNFWGIGAYGGYTYGPMSITADIASTSIYNKLQQDPDARMSMSTLKADVQASVLTIGLRGDYTFALEAIDITPHAGVRFTSISSGEYDIKSNGTLSRSSGIQQRFWSIPVGVRLGKSYIPVDVRLGDGYNPVDVRMRKDYSTSSGWVISPNVDITMITHFDDPSDSERLRYTGLSDEIDLHTKPHEDITCKGTASIEARHDTISLALNYSYEAGSVTSAHGVYASFKWEF